jgi:hypothetical protein
MLQDLAEAHQLLGEGQLAVPNQVEEVDAELEMTAITRKRSKPQPNRTSATTGISSHRRSQPSPHQISNSARAYSNSHTMREEDDALIIDDELQQLPLLRGDRADDSSTLEMSPAANERRNLFISMLRFTTIGFPA